jgi:hypothetical protein
VQSIIGYSIEEIITSHRPKIDSSKKQYPIIMPSKILPESPINSLACGLLKIRNDNKIIIKISEKYFDKIL